MNNVSLVGRLTRDVELKYTNSQTAVATGTLAVNRTFKSQNGEREADFINIVAWRKTAEILSNYTSKGSQIGITGRIQTRNYEGNDGKRVYVTEVVAEQVALLDSKPENQNQNSQL
ncbi:single-strand binding protein [Streptococcus pseudoporcinus]|uniref:Single-stranded DNA-binding protein n=1 Tax=Streptococcus pseudoporcinus TaxID=361101 RepID=A0A4U9XPU4_9STRE|nr:single-stranded DNA-binding protein [Streptococcus pseudoporcinus]VTS14798.1 single-strand binding protein [Streptococcus pseudoporcinus]